MIHYNHFSVAQAQVLSFVFIFSRTRKSLYVTFINMRLELQYSKQQLLEGTSIKS